jgi:undecaprenyl diphosphate synthase
MERTKKNKALVVNFALAYGGRQEITDAVNKIVKQIKQGKIKINNINEKLITKNLYLKSEPDLMIRPGGEIRTSNFLTWQSIYSEWIFIDKLWPEFTKKDLIDCIVEFNKRERRFGE